MLRYSIPPDSVSCLLENDVDMKMMFRSLTRFNSDYVEIMGFGSCRPILFIDATFVKNKYKGQLIGATAKDANQGLYPVAFAIVDAES
ncbi:hypothetical protein M0R45_001667 [Rubus argutus]|uniref:MULE transposase domain-containing protein n=1 Tax=Rubus argutus TaxID=59490 RepID=A0AAW1VK66_RUBAR